MRLDREKTVLQERGEVILFAGATLAETMEMVLDLGIDPRQVLLSTVSLRLLSAAVPESSEQA